MGFKALDNKGKVVTYYLNASPSIGKIYGGFCDHKELITYIDRLMDEFLLDHNKANPKKKE